VWLHTPETKQERGDHGLDVVAAAGQGDGAQRVHDVFDDLKAQPDHRAVDDAVEHAVHLGAGHQHDGDDAEGLGDLLDRRTGQRGAPVGRQVRRAQLRDEVVEGRAARDRDGGGHQATPGEGEHEQGGRLPLQEVHQAHPDAPGQHQREHDPERGQPDQPRPGVGTGLDGRGAVATQSELRGHSVSAGSYRRVRVLASIAGRVRPRSRSAPLTVTSMVRPSAMKTA
jgi:hypothetical protein